MYHIRSLLLLYGLLALFAYQAQVNAQSGSPKPTPGPHPLADEDCPDENSGEDKFGNDSLCDSFQALRATIDKNELVELIQSHYQCDSKFRKALNYYNTTRFRLVAQQLQHSEAYANLLKELRADGVDTTDIENIVDIFACIMLPTPLADRDCDCKAMRGHTFVGDLLAAMPHNKVHAYTAAARAKDTNFARFVDALSSPEFQERLRSDMMKRDVMRPLRVLRRNGWNMPELLRGGMKILTW